MPDHTKDDLLNLFEVLRGRYGTLHAQIDEDEKFIRGDFGHNFIPDDWNDEGLDPIILDTAYKAVENAADHILTTPRIFVPPRPMKDSKEAAQDLAERMRRFLDLWWRRVHVDQGLPMFRARKDIIKGRLILKKTIDWDLLPELPEEGASRTVKGAWKRAVEKAFRRDFPWKLEVLPRKSVYEDPEQPWDPHYVFELKRVTIGGVKRIFPDADAVKDSDALLETVEWLEYYSKPHGDDQGQHIVWIEGERVFDDVNPYSWMLDEKWRGYIPYFVGDPGWGYDEYNDDEIRPENRYVGLILPLRTMLVAESRQITAVESLLRLHVWPVLLGWGTDFENKQFNYGPGQTYEFTDDTQRIEHLKSVEAPATSFQFLQKMQIELDRSTKFGALGGSPQRGVDTATEADLNIRNAATKLSGPVAALARIIGRINETIFQDIEMVLETPVTIFGGTRTDEGEITLKPSEIGGYWHTFVELTTSDEKTLEARNARLAADLYRILPVSARGALERAGYASPLEEMEERAVEDLGRMEPMQLAQLLMALSAMGPMGEIVQASVVQQMQGGPPPAGAGGTSDALALTSVDGAGNPNEPVVSEARANAQADQGQRAFQ